MQLIKVSEKYTHTAWDGAGAHQIITDFVTDITSCYTFTMPVVDNIVITDDGSSSITFSGDVRLYIDSSTYICLSLAKSIYSGSTGYCSPKIDIYTGVGSRTIRSLSNDGWDSGANVYYQYAIWKTETDHIVVSWDVNKNLSYLDAMSSGLCFVIGTSTNAYSNVSIPAIMIVSCYSWYKGESPKFKNWNRDNNYLLMVNDKCRAIIVEELVRRDRDDAANVVSDIAVLAPVVSPNNHYIMDNILVSSLIPTCFSDTYSTLIYNGHQYAQFGRYLLLDESEV